jgi:hypothetical protein
MILALDPGTEESAYLFMGLDGTVRDFGFEDNQIILSVISAREYDELIIEEVRSYGQRVGRETLETVKWTGRFAEAAARRHIPVQARWVGRKEVVGHWCESTSAGDSGLRCALEDKYGKLTKPYNNHTRAALAIAGYWHAKYEKNNIT